MSIGSLAELILDKKSYLKLTEDERKTINLLEEIEVELIKDGLDPDNLEMKIFMDFINKKIKNSINENNSAMIRKYKLLKRKINLSIRRLEKKRMKKTNEKNE